MECYCEEEMNYLKRKLRAMMNTSVVVPILSNFVTFSSDLSFSIYTYNKLKNWDGTLEYSTDTINWTTWTGTSISSAVSNGSYKLYVRGTGNTYMNTLSKELNGRWVLTGSNISCSGRIDNLLDHATVSLGGQPTMAFCCYCYMFSGCTSLISAPNLPATTLADYCYYYMFRGCTSLTSAPSLPANTLASNCYESMFSGCIGLTQAPNLPATILASGCYNQMFYRCTSLTIAPSLPANTLASNCYNYMFYGCTSLIQVPNLPATTLANYCYRAMFFSCTLIKLSATQVGEYQTAYRIPTTDTGTDATDALADMFTNTGGTFTGTPTINTTYYTSNTVV